MLNGKLSLRSRHVPGGLFFGPPAWDAPVWPAHDNANVLCLGGKTQGALALGEILDVFFNTKFEGGRHERRIAKILDIERKYAR